MIAAEHIKECRQCGALSEHYVSITTACKTCWKNRVKANRLSKIAQYRLYDRQRNKLPYRKQAFLNKTRRKRRRMGPAYTRAHNMVRRAVAAGTLVRPDICQQCRQMRRVEGHHDDYTKPLDVMWLCTVCHAARHRTLGRLGDGV